MFCHLLNIKCHWYSVLCWYKKSLYDCTQANVSFTSFTLKYELIRCPVREKRSVLTSAQSDVHTWLAALLETNSCGIPITELIQGQKLPVLSFSSRNSVVIRISRFKISPQTASAIVAYRESIEGCFSIRFFIVFRWESAWRIKRTAISKLSLSVWIPVVFARLSAFWRLWIQYSAFASAQRSQWRYCRIEQSLCPKSETLHPNALQPCLRRCTSNRRGLSNIIHTFAKRDRSTFMAQN